MQAAEDRTANELARLPTPRRPARPGSGAADRGCSKRRTRSGPIAVALTPKGKSVRERALERMTDPPAALATLSPTDQRALRDILRRLNLGERHPESSERP
jgi:hypothetical protein